MADTSVTPCTILHEDKWLIIIAKPHGVLSHPNSHKAASQDSCAFHGDYDPAERSFKKGKQRTWLIHRLDQDTSGALLAQSSSITDYDGASKDLIVVALTEAPEASYGANATSR